MVFSVDSKPSMRTLAAGAQRPVGAFGQRYPINVAAKSDSTAVGEVRRRRFVTVLHMPRGFFHQGPASGANFHVCRL